MNPEKRHRATRGPEILALLLLFSTQVLLAAPFGRSQAKQAAYGPGSIAIVPFVFIGRVDEDLTMSFLDRLISLKTGSRFVDGASFRSHLAKGVNYRSDAPIAALLKAAKAANAEVLIVGEATTYKFLDAPGVKLRVRVLSVESGNELQRSIAEETSWTLPGAKSEAGDTAAKKIAKQWREGSPRN